MSDPMLRDLIRIVREADHILERIGGGTKHWVRDCFLPVLTRRGYAIERVREPDYMQWNRRQEKIRKAIRLEKIGRFKS